MLEAIAIRFLWVLYALRLKRTPGLCPPRCNRGHSYKWPCRNRVRRGYPSRIESYLSRPKVHEKNNRPEAHFYIDIKGNITQMIPKAKLSNTQFLGFDGAKEGFKDLVMDGVLAYENRKQDG